MEKTSERQKTRTQEDKRYSQSIHERLNQTATHVGKNIAQRTPETPQMTSVPNVGSVPNKKETKPLTLATQKSQKTKFAATMI